MAGGTRYNPSGGAEKLAARIRKIEDDVTRLRRAITGLGIRIDPATNSLVVDSGRGIRVVDDDGHIVSLSGALPSPDYDRADGSRQPGFVLSREDNTTALFLGDFDPTVPPYKQALQWLDRAGNIVVADDTNSGRGLANPWIGGGSVLGDTNVARWPATASGTFTDIAFTWWRIQNPRLQWDIQHVADAATAGEVRMLVDGTQVDSTQTVGTSFGLWSRFSVAIPGSHQPGDFVAVQLQARRTSGTGTVYAQALRLCGDQSP